MWYTTSFDSCPAFSLSTQPTGTNKTLQIVKPHQPSAIFFLLNDSSLLHQCLSGYCPLTHTISVAIDSLYYSHALHRWWHHHSNRSPLAYVWLQLHMTLQQMTTSGKIQLGPQNIHLLDNQYFHWLPLTMALQCIVPVLLAFSYHNYHLTHRFLTVPNTTTDKNHWPTITFWFLVTSS